MSHATLASFHAILHPGISETLKKNQKNVPPTSVTRNDASSQRDQSHATLASNARYSGIEYMSYWHQSHVTLHPKQCHQIGILASNACYIGNHWHQCHAILQLNVPCLCTLRTALASMSYHSATECAMFVHTAYCAGINVMPFCH